ncbi:MAG: hypothetical protein ACOYM2_04805 [Rectinemataceae bacterium]
MTEVMEQERDPAEEQTAAGLNTTQGIKTSLKFTSHERDRLRSLAKRVAELAARPEEKRKAKLWTSHNDLESDTPLLFCDPENGWNEIIPSATLECRDPLARVWEMHLLKEIYWGSEMLDDRVIQPFFDVPYNYKDMGWGIREKRVGGSHGGAYTWEPPLRDYGRDFEKLRFPELLIDRDQTGRVADLAGELFGGVLTVRLRGIWWWTLGMTWDYITLRGLQNFMLDLYDNPDWVKKTMKFLSDGLLRKLDFLEANGLLALNTGGTYVGSGGFGWTGQLPVAGFEADKVRLRDMWGFCESQETVGVSAEMFEEFIFPYQLPILERFGLNCYGCCEPVDPRWHVLKRIPRLRRVSVSPWANRPLMAEAMGKDFIMSLKPSPAPLAVATMDEDAIRLSLRKDLKDTRGCVVELIMKDNNTLGRRPERAKRWVEIAREEIGRL